MSTKGEMTREQAVDIVGEAAVVKVESENCQFTNRVQCDGDTRTEFSASVRCKDRDGNEVTLVAYYYQEQTDIDAVQNLDELNWEIAGYEIT